MSVRATGAAVLAYLLLTLGLTYPFSTHLTTHVLSHGTDMDLAVWSVGWNVHAFTHAPWRIFDANIFFPFHNALAYSENLIGASFVAAPVIWLTGNTILGMNIAALFSVFAGAVGAFLLARRLGLSGGAAFFAGLVFAFAPPRFLRMDQLPISSVQWIPFALLALHLYLDTRRRGYLWTAAALFSLEALTSGHGTAMLTLASALLLLWRWRMGEPIDFARRVRDIGWQGVLALVPAALVYIPYRMAQVEVGLKRQLDDWSIATSSFFSSPTHVDQWLRAQMPDFAWLKAEPDAWLFPGVVPLVLASLGLFAHWSDTDPEPRDRAWRRLALVLEVLAVIAFGVAVTVAITGGVKIMAGREVFLRAHGASPWVQCAVLVLARLLLRRRVPLISPGVRLARWWAHLRAWRAAVATADHRWLYAGLFLIGIWMSIPPPFSLWRWIYWVPGLNFVRVPSRFTVVGMLGLGLVAAAGLDWLMRGCRAAVRVLIATVAVVLFIAESAMVPLDMVQFENDATPIDRWAASLPPGAALLDMPMSDSLSIPLREQWTTRIMLHSMSHWKPVFVGFSGIQPPGYMDNYWKLVNFPDAESLATARRLGITHVILHMGKVDPRETAMVEAKYAQFAADVTLVHTEGEGRVYAIRP